MSLFFKSVSFTLASEFETPMYCVLPEDFIGHSFSLNDIIACMLDQINGLNVFHCVRDIEFNSLILCKLFVLALFALFTLQQILQLT